MIAAFQAREKARPDMQSPHRRIAIGKARLLKSLREFYVFVEGTEKFIERTVEFTDFAPHAKVLMQSKFTLELRASEWVNDEVVDFFRGVPRPVPFARIIRPDEENAPAMAVDAVQKAREIRMAAIDEKDASPLRRRSFVRARPRIRFGRVPESPPEGIDPSFFGRNGIRRYGNESIFHGGFPSLSFRLV